MAITKIFIKGRYKCAGAAMLDSTDASAVRLGYVNLDATFNYIFETTGEVRPFIEGGGGMATT